MPPRLLALVISGALGLFGVGCGTIIFNDDFEADPVAAAPLAVPAGNPVDDSLTVQGSAGSIVVIDSAPHGSKAVRMERTGQLPQVALECVTGSGPHTDGDYFISYKAYSPNIAAPQLTAAIKSSKGQRAFELGARGGEFRLSSGEALDVVVGGGYAANTVHSIAARIDLGAGRFWLSIGGVEVASEKPFLDAGFADLHALRFDFPPPTLEALPASYVIDDIVIRK